MPALEPSAIQITTVVHEFMFVHITDPSLQYLSFTYNITDTNKQVLRKGNFASMVMQIRFSHLPDGKYLFCISTGNYDPFACLFKKRSPDTGEGSNTVY